MEKWAGHKNKGIEAANRVGVWTSFCLLVLAGFVIFGAVRVMDIKKTYTELHRQVEENKINIGRINARINGQAN